MKAFSVISLLLTSLSAAQPADQPGVAAATSAAAPTAPPSLPGVPSVPGAAKLINNPAVPSLPQPAAAAAAPPAPAPPAPPAPAPAPVVGANNNNNGGNGGDPCSTEGDSKCASDGKNKFWTCAKGRWQLMTCDGNTVCGQSGSNKAVCHDPSKPTQQQSLTGPILQKCDSVGDGKCASEGKNKYYSCTPQGWQLQTCEGNTICGQVSNNKVTCHDPSKPVDTAANQPKIHCDTLNSTMCDSTDKTSFYSCVNNTWIKMKCDSANICMVRGNKARCVDQATANAPQQPCKHEKATQCAPDNKKIYQLCVDNYWTNSTCANDNYCLYRNGKAICVDKQTAEAPQQPCKTDGATQCAGDDDSIFQICTDNFWTNSTCDKGNVCGMKQGKALCHDPSQPINDVPDQPCDDDKATRCIAGNETLYQVCSSKLWMNLTCDGDNVCRMKDKAVVCVDKNNAGKADGLDYSMGTPTAFVPVSKAISLHTMYSWISGAALIAASIAFGVGL